jgi:hypothetical protein
MLNVSQDAINLDEGDTSSASSWRRRVGRVSQSMSLIGSGWYNIVDNVNQWSARGGLAWSL